MPEGTPGLGVAPWDCAGAGGARGALALFGMAAVMSQDGPTSPLRWTSVLVRLLEHGGPRRWLWRWL